MSKIITTHLTVNATAEDVWATLTDLASYHAWNPFITDAAGTVAVGERLDLTIQPPGGRAMAFRPWVTAVEEHRYLEWLGRLAMPGIFDGRHSFKLTPMGGSRTLVQQSETFTGGLVPFTGHLLVRTQAGFVAMNQALARADPSDHQRSHRRRTTRQVAPSSADNTYAASVTGTPGRRGVATPSLPALQ